MLHQGHPSRGAGAGVDMSLGVPRAHCTRVGLGKQLELELVWAGGSQGSPPQGHLVGLFGSGVGHPGGLSVCLGAAFLGLLELEQARVHFRGPAELARALGPCSHCTIKAEGEHKKWHSPAPPVLERVLVDPCLVGRCSRVKCVSFICSLVTL